MIGVSLKELMLEMIGSIFIVFYTCKTIIHLDQIIYDNKQSKHLYCLFSIVYSTITSLFVFVGNSKRSFYNPILTFLNFIFQKEISFKDLFSLIFTQLIGSIVGSSLVILSINSDQIRMLKDSSIIGYIKRNPSFNLLSCFIFEIIAGILITFILMHFNKKLENKEDKTNMVIFRWLSHLLISMIGYRITGGCLNPIMIIGPSLITFDLNNSQWYYYIGPLIGMYFTYWIFKELTLKKIEEEIIFKKYLENKNKIIQS